MNIQELATRTGSAERQIRYMIAEGFIPPPRGPRSRPDYGDDHVDAIRRYAGLRAIGLPPTAIRILGQSGEAVTLSIADGISLLVETRLVGQPLDLAALADRIIEILKQLQGKSPS